MKHTILICTVLLLGLGTSLSAQEGYQHGIGLRAGNLAGVTYKHFFSFPHAVEGIIGFNYENGRLGTLTGLYEYHLFINYDLNAYFGAGITLGANRDEFRFLGELIAGLEYRLPNFPLSFSLDLKPAFHVFDSRFFFNEYALSIRYIL